MTCSICGGLVIWMGPLTALTHAECRSCGGWNCQEVDSPPDEKEEDGDPDYTLDDLEWAERYPHLCDEKGGAE